MCQTAASILQTLACRNISLKVRTEQNHWRKGQPIEMREMVKKTKIAPLMKSGYSDKTMVEALRILLEVIKWQQKESVFQDTVQPR